jgi:hypothetical protein
LDSLRLYFRDHPASYHSKTDFFGHKRLAPQGRFSNLPMSSNMVYPRNMGRLENLPYIFLLPHASL